MYAWLGCPELKQGRGLELFILPPQTIEDQERLDASFAFKALLASFFVLDGGGPCYGLGLALG